MVNVKFKEERTWANRVIGASNKTNVLARAKMLDGFHTPAIAVQELLKREKFRHRIWEPANGYHRISKILEKAGYKIYTSDIKLWCKKTRKRRAFQKFKHLPFNKRHDIITNPPFRQAQEFIEIAMQLLKSNGKLALLLRLQFLEGQKRKLLFEKYPPKRVYIFSYRLPRMHRFGYTGKASTSVLCFAWYIWIKGYQGKTELRWI
jgi:hypothetical protein